MSTEKATASALARTEIVNGWTLGFTGDREPRVRDIELGERLGYARPRKLRDLVRRLHRAGELPGTMVCHVAGQGRPTVGRVEYWLAEADAHFVVSQSQTATARAVLREMIAVYLAFRRGELVAATPALLDAAMVNSARVREDRASMRKLRLCIHRVRLARGYSLQQIHGHIRRSQQISSPFAIALPLLPFVLAGLEALETCEISLGPRALAEPSKQLDMFDGEPTKH